MENNDLIFFTNEEGYTLYDRFNKILSNNVQFFDILLDILEVVVSTKCINHQKMQKKQESLLD